MPKSLPMITLVCFVTILAVCLIGRAYDHYTECHPIYFEDGSAALCNGNVLDAETRKERPYASVVNSERP